MRACLGLAALLLCSTPVPVAAQTPEQLDQLEPGAGEWQMEYSGTIDKHGHGEHVIEAMVGLSARLAAGAEIEAEVENPGLGFETFGPKILYRITSDEAPIAVGVQLQLGLDGDAKVAETEVRLIAETESKTWWAQANVMLRHSREEKSKATRLAYAWSLQRTIFKSAWFGIEGSGQSARLGSDAAGAQGHGHFAGPSLTLKWNSSPQSELEMGFAYLHRLSGEVVRSTGRIFVQFSF